jgi:antitoxin component of MazEF toxin-antitoxin module
MNEQTAENIQKCGNSLTIRIFQLLNEGGWKTSLSPRYIDPESNVIREIDLIAEKSFEMRGKNGDYFYLVHRLIIEAKYLNKEWVFYLTEGNSTTEEHEIVNKTHRLIPNELEVKMIVEHWDEYFKIISEIANRYNVQTLAVLSATNNTENRERETSYNAATSSIIKTIQYEQEKSADSQLNQLVFYYPIIVIDGLHLHGLPSTIDTKDLEEIKKQLTTHSHLVSKVNNILKINFVEQESKEYFDQDSYYFDIIRIEEFPDLIQSINDKMPLVFDLTMTLINKL